MRTGKDQYAYTFTQYEYGFTMANSQLFLSPWKFFQHLKKTII